MDNNYIPTARYCYQLGNHYICTNNEALASILYDLKRLEACDSSKQFFIYISTVVALKSFAEEHNLEDNQEYANSIKTLKSIIADFGANPTKEQRAEFIRRAYEVAPAIATFYQDNDNK